MDLNFYLVDSEYVNYLKTKECSKRGFSRVPDMSYGESRKPKFLCGIVLQVHGLNYYVPVSSYKQKKPDNFLIEVNGRVASSLRFNYMFPVPSDCLSIRQISSESDYAYKRLLRAELDYCRLYQHTIHYLAERTYHRVLIGKNLGLVHNSCDFLLLEQACLEYTKKPPEQTKQPSFSDRLSAATEKAAAFNQQRDQQPFPIKAPKHDSPSK